MAGGIFDLICISVAVPKKSEKKKREKKGIIFFLWNKIDLVTHCYIASNIVKKIH